MKREMTCLKRTNDLFTIGKRLIEVGNDLFSTRK